MVRAGPAAQVRQKKERAAAAAANQRRRRDARHTDRVPGER